jgi:hypothetical protein
MGREFSQHNEVFPDLTCIIKSSNHQIIKSSNHHHQIERLVFFEKEIKLCVCSDE